MFPEIHPLRDPGDSEIALKTNKDYFYNGQQVPETQPLHLQNTGSEAVHQTVCLNLHSQYLALQLIF